MPPPVRPGYARVAFREPFWLEDLGRVSAEGKRVALAARSRLEREGIDLRREPRPFDPNRPLYLDQCVKVYLPRLGGNWRLVLEARRSPAGLVFLSLAFGVAHPPGSSSRWNVYELAYHRLYGARPPTRI